MSSAFNFIPKMTHFKGLQQFQGRSDVYQYSNVQKVLAGQLAILATQPMITKVQVIAIAKFKTLQLNS